MLSIQICNHHEVILTRCNLAHIWWGLVTEFKGNELSRDIRGPGSVAISIQGSRMRTRLGNRRRPVNCDVECELYPAKRLADNTASNGKCLQKPPETNSFWICPAYFGGNHFSRIQRITLDRRDGTILDNPINYKTSYIPSAVLSTRITVFGC
jgi:hypothetical protein